MLKHTPSLFGLSVFVCLLGGCVPNATGNEGIVAETSEPEASSGDKVANRTTKPGASIGFTHAFQATPETGQNGTVTVSMTHNYTNVLMELSAYGGDSLTVGSGKMTKTVQLLEPGTDTWDLSFNPATDGVNYINVQANVRLESGKTLSRSYAIRVETGEGSSQKQENVTEVILPADESITD